MSQTDVKSFSNHVFVLIKNTLYPCTSAPNDKIDIQRLNSKRVCRLREPVVSAGPVGGGECCPSCALHACSGLVSDRELHWCSRR